MMLNAIRTALPALLLVSAVLFAAEPAVNPTDAEPAVNTSAPDQAAAPDANDAPAPVSTAATEAEPAVATTASGTRPANDRLKLDTTIVTGNRELPKVLYIVPWKKADLGELPAQPFNTLLDEVLTPVDRDVFRREVTYYGVISSGGSTPGAAAPPPATPAGNPSHSDEK
jgi:hypothetical protein